MSRTHEEIVKEVAFGLSEIYTVGLTLMHIHKVGKPVTNAGIAGMLAEDLESHSPEEQAVWLAAQRRN